MNLARLLGELDDGIELSNATSVPALVARSRLWTTTVATVQTRRRRAWLADKDRYCASSVVNPECLQAAFLRSPDPDRRDRWGPSTARASEMR
jgi:hypothetical protein